MNLFTKSLIAAAALVATAIAPIGSAHAAGVYTKAPSGKHHVHKGGPGYHYKRGPKVTYPRGYHKPRRPNVVHRGNNNAAALGLIGFAAGAIVGSALAR